MSLPVSQRTIVRDAILAVLDTRKDKQSVRVSQFNTSKRYLNAQETTKGNTYCVIVGDESPSGRAMQSEKWDMEVKIVCYANHADDPHAIVDAMIEDAQDAMMMVRDQLRTDHIVRDIESVSITPDERTTEALPWGQAVRTWTVSHERK